VYSIGHNEGLGSEDTSAGRRRAGGTIEQTAPSKIDRSKRRLDRHSESWRYPRVRSRGLNRGYQDLAGVPRRVGRGTRRGLARTVTVATAAEVWTDAIPGLVSTVAVRRVWVRSSYVVRCKENVAERGLTHE